MEEAGAAQGPTSVERLNAQAYQANVGARQGGCSVNVVAPSDSVRAVHSFAAVSRGHAQVSRFPFTLDSMLNLSFADNAGE
jgi:hypothetical protein